MWLEVSSTSFRSKDKECLVFMRFKYVIDLTGSGVDFLDQLTDEAKECMAIADSLYTEVSDELFSGHILVKFLELIFKHKEQFLSIWELSKYDFFC